MDRFCEYMVKREKNKVDYILEVVLIFVAVYMSFLTLSLFSIFKSFTLLVVVAIWYGVVYLMRKKNIEYEYILTNNILDIDRIFAKRSRKRITSIDIAKIDYLRPAEKHDLEQNPEFTDHNLCRCKTASDTYVMKFVRKGKVHRIFITLNEKMKENLKEVNPACVTVELEEEK